jgi:hypothetical protein
MINTAAASQVRAGPFSLVTYAIPATGAPMIATPATITNPIIGAVLRPP